MDKINGIRIENYELFGDHGQPSAFVTRRWARQEAAIDQHNARVAMEVWQQTALRAYSKLGRA